MEPNVVMYKEGEPSWITWIKKRIKKENKNFIALFQGPTGVGKTWAALSVAAMIDEEFNVDQVAFSLKELMQIINADWFKEKKWKIVIFDEPQITISNRKWQSTMNQMMNYLLSTFRHQNIILFFCSPYRDFLDSQSMKLLHCIYECRGVDTKKNMSRLRGKLQQYNSKMKKTYEHSLQVIRGSRYNPLTIWGVPKPPQELIDPYEQKKEDFTSNLNKEILQKIEAEQDKSESDKEEPIGSLRDNELQLYNYIKENPNKLQIEYARELGLSTPKVSRLVKKIEKKGVYVRKYIKKADSSSNFKKLGSRTKTARHQLKLQSSKSGGKLTK